MKRSEGVERQRVSDRDRYRPTQRAETSEREDRGRETERGKRVRRRERESDGERGRGREESTTYYNNKMINERLNPFPDRTFWIPVRRSCRVALMETSFMSQ